VTYASVKRPRYVNSALGSLYSAVEIYSWPLVRAATGFFFLPHGMQKLFGFWGGDIVKTAQGFAKQGLHPTLFGPITSAASSFWAGFVSFSAC
jgi:uncharacterized membrane protein YphA (DoxX/SURF4 family)